ncbi:MAG: MaoC family dehydratase N-terminal domain-containing protein, partial [Chloroflexi bacterium]|nr:MaoC family dehydratase N-terminal domain-containing protein [Chloroflexota bacterium]
MATQSSESQLDFSAARTFVGRNILKEPKVGIEVVERSSIRRQLEVLEMDCPLHYDDAVARKHGYEGLVSPVHMVQTFQVSSLWEPGMPSLWTTEDPFFTVSGTGRAGNVEVIPTPGTAGFITDLEVESLRPLYLGDRVSQTSQTLLDVNPRRTRVGDGGFLTSESMFVNQRGEPVARQKMTLYTYVPHPQPAGGGGGRPDGAGQAAEKKRAIPSRQSTPVDWGFQRFWEDVKEGDEVGEVQYPLTIQRMVMAAGANRDFNAIHHSTVAAQRGGAPDMYAMNYFHNGMWERVVREFIGLDGKILKTGPFRMKVFSPVGDTVVVRGKVVRKYKEGGAGLVELEIQSLLASSENVSVGPGPVTVS